MKRIEAALEELEDFPETSPVGRSEKALYKALPSFLSHIRGTIDAIEARKSK